MTDIFTPTGTILNNQKTRELIYRQFSCKMYPICLRFAGNRMEADDILQEGFIRVFKNLDHFRNEGSFEGWLRKTFINTAINYYNKNKRINCTIELTGIHEPSGTDENAYDILSHEELLALINELPVGYRTVFNLNVIEGYTHKEIGDMLNISDNTSKSQLARAKQTLRERIEQLMREKIKVPYSGLTVFRNRKKRETLLRKAG